MKRLRIPLNRTLLYIFVLIMLIMGILRFDVAKFITSENTVIEKDIRSTTRKVDDQAQRLNRIHNVCLNRKTKINARHFINYDNITNLAYCYLPKCGCTSWKQIYWIISRMDKNGNIPKGYLNMDRNTLHTNLNVLKHPSPDMFKKTINFMFVRDPYSKLWSGYLDKFFLPNFWIAYGRHVGGKGKNKNQCANNITFKTFIEYIISNSRSRKEEHWSPMINLCDPCVFRPQFVGKLESFADDRDSFLKSVGQEKVLKYIHNQSERSKHEMSMLVSDYYKAYTDGSLSKCISPGDFNHRIWTLFQLNGYIPSNISFNPIIPRNESEMIRHINSVLQSTPLNKQALKQQKKQSMIDAYKSLPIEYMEELSRYYQQDFEMFGYDPKPKELF